MTTRLNEKLNQPSRIASIESPSPARNGQEEQIINETRRQISAAQNLELGSEAPSAPKPSGSGG